MKRTIAKIALALAALPPASSWAGEPDKPASKPSAAEHARHAEVVAQELSAKAGSDFTIQTTKIQIPAGQTRADVVIKLVDDGAPEGIEFFALRLESVHNAKWTGNSPGVTIADAPTATRSA